MLIYVPLEHIEGRYTVHMDRDIEAYLNAQDIDAALAKPVVKGLIKLIQLRNEHSAFNGEFIAKGEGSVCRLSWHDDSSSIELKVDFASREVMILDQRDGGQSMTNLADLLA